VIPTTADDLIVAPTLRWLDYPYNFVEARILLLAIGLTESGFETRLQISGPARGFWQFELYGGCEEFYSSLKLRKFRDAALELGFVARPGATYGLIGNGADHLACLMARAILWLEPKPLPSIGDVDEAYRQYRARWRPGKPSKARFVRSYETAIEVVTG
jgi:hypothetical protein